MIFKTFQNVFSLKIFQKLELCSTRFSAERLQQKRKGKRICTHPIPSHPIPSTENSLSSSLQGSSQTYSFLLLYKFHPKLYFNSRSTCIKFPPREISKGEGNPLAENADFFHRKFSPVLSSNVCFEYSKRNKAASVPSSFTYFTFQGQKRYLFKSGFRSLAEIGKCEERSQSKFQSNCKKM